MKKIDRYFHEYGSSGLRSYIYANPLFEEYRSRLIQFFINNCIFTLVIEKRNIDLFFTKLGTIPCLTKSRGGFSLSNEIYWIIE